MGSVWGEDKVEHSETAPGNAAFGSYLKKVREGRRLSLDAVEELSAGFPEKVTKSHLSRIENGLALPSFPRLMALSHIYGMPIASLAERYELDLRREMTPVDLGDRTDEEVLKEVEQLRITGRYSEALDILFALLDRPEAVAEPKEIDLRLQIAYCLIQTGHIEFAKAICEDLVSRKNVSHLQRLQSVQLFAMCCLRRGRHAVALMALNQIAADLDHPDTPARLAADLNAIRGSTYLCAGDALRAIDELTRAKAIYSRLLNPREACRAGLALSEALIEAHRYDDAARSLDSELVVAESNGFERHRAIAFSHLCVLSYRREELSAAEQHAIRSNTIARPIDLVDVVFRNTFYLWRIALRRDDRGAAKLNERSLRSSLGRIETQLAEAEEFRAFLARGDHDEQA